MVKRIVPKHGKVDANLKDLRISVIALLGFAGFFRFNELANIKASHISFADDHMSIVIPSSKTDVYREGNKRLLLLERTMPLVQLIWFLGICLLQGWTIVQAVS